MIHRCTVVLVVAFCMLFEVAAYADAPAPPQVYLLTHAAPPLPPSAGAPVGSGIVATITNAIVQLGLSSNARAMESAARFAPARDAQKDRDAISLGVLSPRVSGMGAALAAGGLGSGAITVLSGKKFPVTIGPRLCLGGGGIQLSGRW